MKMKFNKNKLVYYIILLSIIVGTIFYYMHNQKLANTKLEARVFMERAEQIVREEKPTPIQSSRFYAVASKDYYDNLNLKKEYASTTLLAILAEIKKNDSQDIATGTRLIGQENWKSEKKPFSPNGGKGDRYILGDDFDYKVKAPPTYLGDEFKKGLVAVKEASDNRSPEHSAAVNFWGGIPGTEAPAGIWQNVFYETSKKHNLTNKEYAYAQMILAESVADAFTECWKVKYTYWTKRPDMTDSSIQTAMPNPPFPGYVSGHSTVSFAAATVLGKLFPQDSEYYIKNAEEAKNSRLWAGIHFPYDNEEGQKLGVAIGEYIIKKENLKPFK